MGANRERWVVVSREGSTYVARCFETDIAATIAEREHKALSVRRVSMADALMDLVEAVDAFLAADVEVIGEAIESMQIARAVMRAIDSEEG